MAYLAPIVRASSTAILLAAGLAALLAACGGDESKEAGCASSGAASAKGVLTIIAAETKDSGDVIADAACQPLYVNDVDDAEKIACTGECAQVWPPLTLPAKGTVRSVMPQEVGSVELVKRPDGRTQVALNDQPLYLFSGDEQDGETDGDGEREAFGGTDYEWSVLTLDDAAPTGASGGSQTPGAQAPGGQAPGSQRPPSAKKPGK